MPSITRRMPRRPAGCIESGPSAPVAGFDAKWLDPAALRRLTGISGQGAIRTQGSAQFDPYRACLGILRAASAAGAQVFERSRVQRILVNGDHVRVRTRHGVVKADRVVIATGYATPGFSSAGGPISHVSHLCPGHRAAERRAASLGLAFRTSWCGTRSVPITMRAGPQTIACCWAAAIDWFGPARGEGRCSQQRHVNCARILRLSSRP